MAYSSNFAGRSWEKKSTYTPPPEPLLGSLLDTIQKVDLIAESRGYTSSARISNCQYVSSFNWRNSRKPSVFIPGKPPRWTPTTELRRPPRDRTEYPIDRNGYHSPKHPFEAAALSVLLTQPEPPKAAFDIVCTSRSLGHLITFCVAGNDFRKFRALVEVVGGVVHIFHRDNAPNELLSNVKGYGHTFPEANTTWDAGTAGSTSHQRVVRYNLGGLNILLRGEIDGYLAESSSAGKSSRQEASLDQLLDGLESSSISSKAVDTNTSTITVKEAGLPVPQSSLFDIKTRSELRKGEDFLAQQLPRLWRSQIPNFILAFHNQGIFNDVSIENVQARIDEWETNNAGGIAVLVALLRRIVDVVTSATERKVEIRATADSQIEVREQLQDAGEAFSPAVRERWEDWLEKARCQPDAGEASSPVGESAAAEDSDGWEGYDWYSGKDVGVPYEPYSDTDSLKDYTACSADSCGYCGQCDY